MANDSHYPHHTSTVRKGGDAIDLELWTEDDKHIATVVLTHAVAVDLLAVVATELTHNPYAR